MSWGGRTIKNNFRMKAGLDVNKIIAALISLTTLIALLLLGIAALLIWAPEILLDIFRIGICIACVFAGLCMLIPLLIVLFNIIRGAINKGQKNKDITE